MQEDLLSSIEIGLVGVVRNFVDARTVEGNDITGD